MMGFQKRMWTNLLVILVLQSQMCWISRAISDSCSVSKQTVKVVEDCPESEEKWREAAEKMNCAEYTDQCDEPERLFYHCVINAFVNQTLEVCAYRRNIVFGYCAEYNFGANRIQENYKTYCKGHRINPCPTGYNSTEAYKYPGCYKLTKTTIEPTTETTLPTTDIRKKGDSFITLIVIGVVIPLVCTVLLVVVIQLHRNKKRGGFCIRHQRQGIYDNRATDSTVGTIHSFSKLEPQDEENICKEERRTLVTVEEERTDTIKRYIAPSGQSFVKEEETKNIIALDESSPENLLRPEEESTKDCQAWLSLLSDGIEKLVQMHSGDDNEDSLPDLKDLNNNYGEPELSLSDDSVELIKEDIATVESFISEYFRKLRNKKSKIFKEIQT